MEDRHHLLSQICCTSETLTLAVVASAWMPKLLGTSLPAIPLLSGHRPPRLLQYLYSLQKTETSIVILPSILRSYVLHT